MRKERIILINLYIAIFIIIVSEILLFLNCKFIKDWFFIIAWWSYIIFFDSLNYRRYKHSLLFHKTGNFIFMAFISVLVWLIFEIINLRLNNWAYFNLPENLIKRWIGYFLAYATVIPALWETSKFVESFLPEKSLSFSFNINNLFIRVSIFIGLIFLLLFLIFPKYFFPLVWLFLIFLLSPINYRFGIKGLLSYLEHGLWFKIVSWLIAGFVAGFFWEFWNFWAVSKWKYFIPYFNFLKIFEMPLLGYFGFPPFALEVLILWNFLFILKNKIKKNILKYLLIFLLIGFYFFCFWLIDKYTWSRNVI